MTDAIIVERVVNAPASKVYGYLTEGDLWTRWQGTGATIDATPGGLFRLHMPNGTTARGEFLSLDPGRRITFTWG